MATRDPQATKQRILDAALREFSDKGIAGARVDAIARRANVNKRMLYYYFGSKEQLFREILQRRIDESTEAFRDIDVAQPGRLACWQADFARDPDYVRLLAWEALESGTCGPVDDSPRLGRLRGWVEAVEAEQRAGNVPADLDAAQLVLSELLLVLGPMLLPQMTRAITGWGATSPEQLARRASFFDALELRMTARETAALMR